MQLPSAKAYRCESCGAALPPGVSTCEYCGSHHNLPVWGGEPDAAPPEPAPPESQRRSHAWTVGLAVVAVLTLATVWYSTR